MESGGSPLISVIVFLCVLILNAIMIAFYSALDNLNETEVEDAVEDGNKKAVAVKSYLNRMSLVTSSLHLITGLCYLITGAYCVPIIAKSFLDVEGSLFGDYRYYVMVFLVSMVGYILLLTVGYAAVRIGGAREEKAAYRLVSLCALFITIVSPLRIVITFVAGMVARLFGVDPSKNLDEVSEDEIISMVNEGHEQGLIESSEAEMIHNIFEFTNKDAQDIMTHRKNMILINGESTFEEALNIMLENSISRFPVYMEDTDNILGVIHIRDCMERMKDKELLQTRICDIDGLIREVSFIPETRNINDLFHSMQEEKNHMAIVVDEYGQTSGLVTMEDILEEIVGNILDEYDEEEPDIVCMEDGSFHISGMAPLDEVAEVLDIDLPVDDYDTVNGYLISLIDRIPSEEEKIKLTAEGYLFEVLSVENKIIQAVRVIKLDITDENEEKPNKEI
ncbi:putative hemolysin [Lachnospiraceae bacterium XBB1006]|nr:putative hemolysin [Lachnospiraceae bacterium XBB1006]